MGDMERMAATALCDKNDPTRLTWREVVMFERIQHIEEKIHKKTVYLGLCTIQHTVRLNHYEVKKFPDRLRHIKSIG